MKTIIIPTFLICCIVVTSGCSEKLPEGLPALFPATLTITLEGKPFANAMVSLSSADGSHSWTSGGITDKNGQLAVYTHGKYQGIPAGKYKVTVDCITSDVPMPQNPTMEQIEEHNRNHPSFRIVPPEYTEKSNTPLEIEITQSKNTLTLDIPKSVKLKISSSP
jgi:fibronectin type 3 domain-containing protein